MSNDQLITLTRSELLEMIPRCAHNGCAEAATRAHPTCVIGDWELRCDAHPGTEENDYGDKAQDLAAAPLVRRLVPPVGSKNGS